MSEWTVAVFMGLAVAVLVALYEIHGVLKIIAYRLDDTNILLRGTEVSTGVNQQLGCISETLGRIKDDIEEQKWIERRADEMLDEVRSIRAHLDAT